MNKGKKRQWDSNSLTLELINSNIYTNKSRTHVRT